MSEEHEYKPWQDKRDVQTIIVNREDNRQILWLKQPVCLPVGSVIELGPPNRDAVVVGVRLLAPQVAGAAAAVMLLVDEGEPSDLLPRDAASRILREHGKG
jgi:hypothetical protein